MSEVYLNYWKGKYGKIIEKYEKEAKDSNGEWKDDRGLAVNSYKMVIEAFLDLTKKQKR